MLVKMIWKYLTLERVIIKYQTSTSWNIINHWSRFCFFVKQARTDAKFRLDLVVVIFNLTLQVNFKEKKNSTMNKFNNRVAIVVVNNLKQEYVYIHIRCRH